ncbi:putative naringenin-chalcone synthase [Planctomycetales bacterium 10988]|nr:putative naringenin-chalcone synthase [Planctomycetales bacterium 10988]
MNQAKRTVLAGLAAAVPRYSMTQQEIVEIGKTLCGVEDGDLDGFLDAIYQGTEIQRRSSVLLERPEGESPRQFFFPASQGPADHGPTTLDRMQRYAQESPQLATKVCRKAIEKAGLSSEAITHLVTVSCTGFSAPGFDLALFESLGLSPETQRTHLGFMGCHGALNALRVGQALARLESKNRILVCAVELCSLHFAYGAQPQQLIANALFADGAAAVVLSSEESKAESPQLPGWRHLASGSLLFPNSQQAMTWTIGNHGYTMTLSRKVPELIAGNLRPWLESWLAQYDLNLSEIATWAVHPGGPKILAAVSESLSLAPDSLDASLSILRRHGNMSSPTILFILEELLRRDAKGPCVALGFGPGLVVEAALLHRE